MRRRLGPPVQLAVALATLVGCVLSWLAARSTAVVAPILDTEPETVSTIYSPPLLVLSLLLATTAGVLAVLGIAGLRRRRSLQRVVNGV